MVLMLWINNGTWDSGKPNPLDGDTDDDGVSDFVFGFFLGSSSIWIWDFEIIWNKNPSLDNNRRVPIERRRKARSVTNNNVTFLFLLLFFLILLMRIEGFCQVNSRR